MCGRLELNETGQHLRSWFGLARGPEILVPKFNIAPSYSTADKWLVRVGSDGARELVPARWWLIPSWWNKPLSQLPTSFNARGEELSHKRMFRELAERQRCLVPATAWYEFQGERGHKRAYHFSLRDDALLALGGVWDTWIDPEQGEVVTSFAIVTTEPTAQAAAIHDRMPLVIAPDDYATWLDPKHADASRLIRPWPQPLKLYRSSGAGNDPRIEGPEVAAPYVAPVERQGSLFQDEPPAAPARKRRAR